MPAYFCRVPWNPPYSTTLREQPLAASSQDYSHCKAAIPYLRESREPALCSLLQSPKRALHTYFTSIPVTLISCLWSQNLGCELKLCRHTTFPRMAQRFLGASHLILLCRPPTEGLALLCHPSLKTKRAAEQRKKRWRFCLHSGREEFLKALSKQRKWAWLLGTIHKYESQMLTSGVSYEN